MYTNEGQDGNDDDESDGSGGDGGDDGDWEPADFEEEPLYDPSVF